MIPSPAALDSVPPSGHSWAMSDPNQAAAEPGAAESIEGEARGGAGLRELLAIAVLIAVAVGSRLAASEYVITRWTSDGGVACLMAKHHAEGKWPLIFYGQHYNGSLEALVAAPFHAYLPPVEMEGDGWTRGSLYRMSYAQTLLGALLALMAYVLCRQAVGVGPALVGSLAVAFGTLPLLENVGGQNHSYHLTSIIGALILLVGVPFARDPRPGRAVALGLLAALGWVNNPQIASFLGAVVLLLLARGQLFAWLRRDRPQTAPWAGWGLLLLGAAYATTLGVVTYLACMEPGARDTLLKAQLGEDVSMQRPEKVLGMLVMGLAALIGVLELLLSQQRGRFMLIGLCFAVPASLAIVPGVINKQRIAAMAEEAGTEPERKLGSPGGLFPQHIPAHAYRLIDQSSSDRRVDGGQLTFQLFGHARAHGHDHVHNAYPVLDPGLWEAFRTLAIALALAGVGVWLHRYGCGLGELLARRAPEASVPLALGVQALLLLCLYCNGPEEIYEKYLQPLWLILALALALLVDAVAKRGRALTAVVVLLIVGFYFTASAYAYAYMQGRWAQGEAETTRDYRHWQQLESIIDTCREQGIEAGYANYWVGYRITYMTDERLVLAEWPWPHNRRVYYEPYNARMRNAGDRRIAMILDTSGTLGDQEIQMGFFDPMFHYKRLILEETREIGMFKVLICRRK